jgi:hypothetical protein
VLFALSRRYIAPFIIFSSQGSAKREKKEYSINKTKTISKEIAKPKTTRRK